MLKIMSSISQVIVNGISLVLWDNTPAVPHAQTKFAIFKSKKQKTLEKEKLEEIEKRYRKLSGESETTPCGPIAAFWIDEG